MPAALLLRFAPAATGLLAVLAAHRVAAQTGGANRVTVVTREFAYELPDTLPAGLTTFHLRNEGKQPHHLMLYRLDPGRTLGDVFAELSAGGPLPAWMHATGGPNSPPPGGESYGTVVLEPGSYVAFCHVKSPDGVVHFQKGMIRKLTVIPAPGRAAPLPPPDLTVTLRDYGFVFSRPPARGRHLIAVTNAGSQTHEFILSRLAPGKTVEDFIAWMNTPHGPPPVRPAGGTTNLAPGSTMEIRVDLAPGRYSVVCRVRDARDGRTHDLHGMRTEFAVR
ncbi:MAG TPA: hypothetical protein VFG66_10380 [Gemmatimonadales bacterium]|nr:hypothetical protein [Gemmatimonadales bacterium]